MPYENVNDKYKDALFKVVFGENPDYRSRSIMSSITAEARGLRKRNCVSATHMKARATSRSWPT